MGYLKGSICIDDIYAAAKANHSAITTAKNGKKYANIIVWTNETPDQYNNIGSIQLNQPKDADDKKVYIGNIKANTPAGEQSTQPTQKATHMDITQSDALPF
jgi:hypothetical protein